MPPAVWPAHRGHPAWRCAPARPASPPGATRRSARLFKHRAARLSWHRSRRRGKRAMGERTVLVEQEGAVLRLTLDRPEKLNSFNEAMQAELAAALAGVEEDKKIRAVLLTGAGRAFSAGQDLADRANGRGRGGPRPRRHARSPLQSAGPSPPGARPAGDRRRQRRRRRARANLALACDIVLAARSASFIQPFCRLGLVPDAGRTFFFPGSSGPPGRGAWPCSARRSGRQAFAWA